MIKVKPADDYVIYDIECDYCDNVYTITMPVEGRLPEDETEEIEACAFCGNPIEDPIERHRHDEDSWD
jgi:hypothetical protein